MSLADAPVAKEGFFVTHFLTAKDQARSREFYVRVLGPKVVLPENPCYLKVANSWIILNVGGGPTPDKPEVILETPRNLSRASCFFEFARGGRVGLLQGMEGQRSGVLDGAARQSRPRVAVLFARSGRVHHRSRTVHAEGD